MVLLLPSTFALDVKVLKTICSHAFWQSRALGMIRSHVLSVLKSASSQVKYPCRTEKVVIFKDVKLCHAFVSFIRSRQQFGAVVTATWLFQRV